MDIFTNTRVNAHEDSFDIDVDDLNEDHPKISQPANIGIVLKDHQLTIAHRCIEYENRNIKLSEFASIAERVAPADNFTTNIGVIGDRVGSGKSYVVLSIIKSNNICNNDKTVIRSSGLNNIVFYLRNQKEVIKTNLIVVPFSLCTQWEGYIKMFKGDMTYKIVNKSKTISEMVGKVMDSIKNLDIILVTSTFYNKFADIVKRENIKFQRIFYDEADNININNCAQLDANFYWFVTASYGNILYPKGFAKQERSLNRYIWCADGLKANGFIKNIFTDLNYSVPHSIMKTLIVKNAEAYVQKSIELPPTRVYTIKCKTPVMISLLNGIVDKNIISCLNAGDVQRALQFINPTQRLTEDNIVSAVVEKYSLQLNNIRVRKSILDQIHYDDPAEKARELQNLDAKEAELEKSINLIKDRIKGGDMCYICYEEHDNKTIVKCCQNSFCFKCINMWLARKANCPLCKSRLTSEELYVLTEESTPIPTKTPEQIKLETIGNVPGFSCSFEKFKNLETLLKSKKNDKVLIFSCYDSSFDNIYPILQSNNISYDYLKGNGNHINNVIDKYKNGNVNVLLVNTRYYGSGFNMENTSDIIMFHKFDTEIEKQVIGRAQRFGRTSPLNIWYLLHENEK